VYNENKNNYLVIFIIWLFLLFGYFHFQYFLFFIIWLCLLFFYYYFIILTIWLFLGFGYCYYLDILLYGYSYYLVATMQARPFTKAMSVCVCYEEGRETQRCKM